jgi:general secretion pathway protein E
MFSLFKKRIDLKRGDEVRTLSVSGSPAAMKPTSTGETAIGDYRFSNEQLERNEDIARVPFVACINKKLSLSPHLFVAVAVVEMSEPEKTAALLVVSTITVEDIAALEDLLLKQGWSLPKTGPQVWRTHPSIIMAVSQGYLDSNWTSSHLTSGNESGKSALWQTFVDVAQWAFDQGANDIDYVVNLKETMSQICFKIDGRYLKPQRWRVPTDTMIQMLGIAWQRGDGGSDATFQQRIEQQCRIEIDLPQDVHIRLRWSGMAVDSGPIVTLRVQKIGSTSGVKTLEDAGYLAWHLDVFNRVIQSRSGMTTLAGTVGSGKSVTLAIMMGMLPEHIKKVSFEDPVEIDMPGVYQKTIIRDLLKADDGADAAFSAGVRALFRSALDAFLLGEVRDPESARVARAVLESGHSLFTTTHASNVMGIFSKFSSPQVGIPLEVLATPGNVRLNVYQTLLPKTCPHCAKSPVDYIQAFALKGGELHEFQAYLAQVERLYDFDSAKLRMRDSRGCPNCFNAEVEALNGFSGRTVAAEMLEPDENICELLLTGNQVSLHRYWRALSNHIYDDPDLTGKTAMEVAVYKASCGIIDPREIELKFESFASIEHKRTTARKTRKAVGPNLRAVGLSK